MKKDKKEKLVRGIILGFMLFFIVLTPIVIVTSIKNSVIINYPLKLINSIALFLLCVVIGLLIDEIFQRRDKK